MKRRRDEHGKTLTLVLALAANVAIAVVKGAAALWTGSSAMLAESLHSLVDAGDGALLLTGERRSRRPPSERHPFGHGAEVYFWSFVVATAIFGIGGGVSIYEGIVHFQHPHAIERLLPNYIVLGSAFLFEGTSLLFAIRTFRRYRRTVPGAEGVLDTVQLGKDPPSFAIVLEDSAALLGIVVAFAGITLSYTLHAPWIDGLASILIGLLLATVAFILGHETHGLLLGESAHPALVKKIRAVVAADPDVLAVRAIRTLHLGPRDILVALELTFRPGMDPFAAARRLRDGVRAQEEAIRHVFLDLAGP